MPRSNKLIELKEEIHPDLHAKVTDYAKSNDFELGYAVEHIFQNFFSDAKNAPARVKQMRTRAAQPAAEKTKKVVA